MKINTLKLQKTTKKTTKDEERRTQKMPSRGASFACKCKCAFPHIKKEYIFFNVAALSKNQSLRLHTLNCIALTTKPFTFINFSVILIKYLHFVPPFLCPFLTCYTFCLSNFFTHTFTPFLILFLVTFPSLGPQHDDNANKLRWSFLSS